MSELFPRVDPEMLKFFREQGMHAQADAIEKQLGIALGAVELELDKFVTKSPACEDIKEAVRRLATVDDPVLIYGETGTGKEIIAKALGANRKTGRFVAINVAAIPKELVESTLFGYTKGAFTGATLEKLGLIQHAESGTLFLDEIGDLSLDLQAKFLRVLQDMKVRRVGALDEEPVKCRFIAATHRDLKQMVADKLFRQDLYARLTTFQLDLPPLRKRLEDCALIMSKLEPKFPAIDWTGVDLSLNVRSLIQYARRFAVLGEVPKPSTKYELGTEPAS